MILTSFDDILKKVTDMDQPKTVALVCAEDEHLQQAVFEVEKSGWLHSVFIGNRAEIVATAEKLGHSLSDDQIYHVDSASAAAALGVQLVRQGKADFLMKGSLPTGELLKPVVNKEKGLSTGRLMSHIAVNEIPAYHKLLVTTDGGMMPYPTLPQKKDIIINAVEALRALGYAQPKVAVLAAVETLNPKMPETIEAAALKDMVGIGQITGCVVEGPISLDLALVKERSIPKNYESPVAGEADILVSPNIQAGNILGKSLVEMAGAKMAGLVLGATCPIVLTSRGSSAEEKFNSLLLAAALSN